MKTDMNIIEGKNIVIFGAGRWGKLCKKRITENYNANVLYFVDSNLSKSGAKVDELPVQPVSSLNNLEDNTVIIVAIRDNQEVCDTLNEMGLHYWCFSPCFRSLYSDDEIPKIGHSVINGDDIEVILQDFNAAENLYKFIAEKENKSRMCRWFLEKSQYVFTASLCSYEGNDRQKGGLDQIRTDSLLLAAEEIKRKNLQGNLAELGVWKAEFASKIHYLFPEKKIYLFDTFEGFAADEIEKELNSGDATDPLLTFKDTSVEQVMKKMNHSDKVVIRKGLFPHTAEGVEDTFCFVSIDCDLYDSITYGLEYFYPRLEKGGYIFVHDYINKKYKGAKRAVQDYCDKNGIPYTVIPDACGTAIITK